MSSVPHSIRSYIRSGSACAHLQRSARPLPTSPVASSSKLSPFARLPPCTCSASIQLPARRHYSSYPSQTSSAPPPRKKRTILDLHSLKAKKIPITMLTAHDYPSAKFIETASSPLPHSPSSSTSTTPPRRGIDVCLVGDSLAMVACGYTDTTKLTLDELLYHARSVARGCKTSLLLVDMPFGTTVSVEAGLKAAVRLVQEGNMDAVKIECGMEGIELVSTLTEVGIPVMAHVGLTPQRQSALSGYRVQGKTATSAWKVYQEALALESAGAFAILLEAIPSKLATFISSRLSIPTVGIGAGSGCDGQVLVQLDMLGVNSLSEKGPRFLKKFADVEGVATGAIRDYVNEVRTRGYPAEEHEYPMEDKEWVEFLGVVKEMGEVNDVD